MSDDGLAFLDTNLLVYAFDASDPARQRIAEDLLSSLMDSDRLCLSTQVLQEFYAVVTRKIGRALSPDEALAILDDLAAWPLLAIEYTAIRDAVLLSRDAVLSFWDALIVIAAVRSGATTLYTEDLNHGQVVRGVRIVNPFRR